MEVYTAKVRINSRNIIEVNVLAKSKQDANEQLEAEFGEGNVVYYPKTI